MWTEYRPVLLDRWHGIWHGRRVIRTRSDDNLTLQVVVYAGRDPRTGRERYLRETVRDTTPTKARKKAEGIERRLKLTVDDGRHVVTDATVAELLDQWLELAAPDLSPRTVSGYRSHIENHIRPTIGDVELAKLTTAHLDRLYGKLRARGLSQMTVRHVHAILRRALGYAVRWQWIPTNPAAVENTAPKITNTPINPPSVEVAQQILTAALARADVDFGTIIALALATGARRGELIALRWMKVDLDDGVITLDTSIVQVGPVLHEKGTKTDEGRRVSIDPDTVARLRAHRQVCLERGLAAGTPLVADAFVCSSSIDGADPLTPDSVSQRFGRLARALGSTARLHDLRHFHASQLLDAGVPITTVSDRLGHKDVSTTLNIYGHPVAEADRRAADTIGRVLGA